MGTSLTEKIEGKVYSAINEISDELDLNFNLYPEVYWVHPGLSFNKIGIPKEFKTYCTHMKKEKRSMFLPSPWSIWIAEDNPIDIYEESGHAIHHKTSKSSLLNQNKEDELSTHVLMEMIGYFSSKIGNSKRRPVFANIPDIIFEREECMKRLTGKHVKEFYIYQQGHNLGEKLFNTYLSGIVSKENIKKLFQTNLDGENIASTIFLRFKYDILNFEERIPPKSVQKILQK